MNLPIQCHATEAMTCNAYYLILDIVCLSIINDIQLADPFTMNVINDFKHYPPFG